MTADAELNRSELERTDPDSMPCAPQLQSEARAIVIETRKLYSECITREIRRAIDGQARSYNDIDDWLAADTSDRSASIIIACLAGMRPEQESEYMARLSSSVTGRVPVVIIGDCEVPQHVVGMLSLGARGYIPTSMSLELMAKALQLVLAGGVFIPAVCLRVSQETPQLESAEHSLFTGRQIDVIDALRQGKPNKIIAFELNMRESTVKVHVRNIMKKLNAKNRTEVSFLVNQMSHNKSLV